MKRVNYVFFTEIITILSEKGEEKMKKATNKNPEAEHDLDFYDRLGLRPPKDLVEDESSMVDEDGYMKLEDGEFTYDFKNRFIDMTNFYTAVEADEFGTVLEFNNGMTYWVDEDLFEVYARIYVSRMNWFERFKESVKELRFSNLFRRKKEILEDKQE